MNHKTLILGTVTIFIFVGTAAFIIPDRLNNAGKYKDYDDSYSEEDEKYEEMYEDEYEEISDEEDKTDALYGNKDGDSTIQSPAEATPNSYTLAEVATHKTSDSCWTAIDGQVYDLTPFIERHPGGVANIMKLCGIDGTDKFTAQHGGQSQPENTLKDYFIGLLI